MHTYKCLTLFKFGVTIPASNFCLMVRWNYFSEVELLL